MKRHLIKPLVWLSRFFEWLAKRCGYQPPVAQPAQVQINVIVSMRPGRMLLRLLMEEAINDAFRDRPRTGRNPEEDNKLLAPLSGAINESIHQGDHRLAAEVFRENYEHILEYEKEDPSAEIHKGALAFDVARAYLQDWDFFAAKH